MSSEVLFSIIVPWFKTEQFLKDCVDSLRKQTVGFENLQVLLVDDGNEDRVVRKVIKTFINDDNVTVCRKEHTGPSASRNLGIDNAVGEFLVFLDSDDCLDPNYLEEALKCARKYPTCDVFYFPMKIMGSEQLDWNQVHFKHIARGGHKLYDYKNDPIKILPSNVACSVIRASVVRDGSIRFNETMRYGEDGYFNTLCLLRNLSICCVNASYYERRRRDGSLSSEKHGRDFYVGAVYENIWNLPYEAFSIYQKTPARSRYLSQYIRNTANHRLSLLSQQTEPVSGIDTSSIPSVVKFLKDLAYRSSTSILPLISVVIPCHECENTIEKLLKKLQWQTFKNWECICVDDSKDEMGYGIVRSMAAKDPRIIPVRNVSNPGAGANRNLGFSMATGRYIWFVDSDDEFPFGKDGLENIYAKLRKNHSDFCVFPTVMYVDGAYTKSFLDVGLNDFGFFKREKITREEMLEEGKFKQFVNAVKMNPWCKIFDGAYLSSNQSKVYFQNTHFSNDNYFTIQVLRTFQTAAFQISAPIYRYNRTATSISGPENRSKNIQDLNLLLDWIKDLDKDDKFDNWLLKDRLVSINTILRQVAEFRISRKLQTREEFYEEVARFLAEPLRKFDPELYPTCDIIQKILLVSNTKNVEKENNTVVEVSASPVISAAPDPTIKDYFKYGGVEEKHDAVFVLGDGSRHRDMELLFAIDSLTKFCYSWLRDIYVVGNKPRCNLDHYSYIHVPCEDVYKNKDANIIYKTKYIINHNKTLSDTFLLCSDDQLVIKACSWKVFAPMYVRKFDQFDYAFRSICMKSNSKNTWLRNLYETLTRFVETNNEIYYYEPHIWSPIEKTSFLRMCNSLTWWKDTANIVFTLYYNFIKYPTPEPIADHMFYAKNEIAWDKVFMRNKAKFIAYNDAAFDSTKFRDQIIGILRREALRRQ